MIVRWRWSNEVNGCAMTVAHVCVCGVTGMTEMMKMMMTWE